MNDGNDLQRGPLLEGAVTVGPQQRLRDERPQVQGGGIEMQMPPPAKPIAKQVVIEQVHHGFIVSVGCQRFAIESVDALLHRLNVYLKDPYETEARWLRGEWKW